VELERELIVAHRASSGRLQKHNRAKDDQINSELHSATLMQLLCRWEHVYLKLFVYNRMRLRTERYTIVCMWCYVQCGKITAAGMRKTERGHLGNRSRNRNGGFIRTPRLAGVRSAAVCEASAAAGRQVADAREPVPVVKMPGAMRLVFDRAAVRCAS
jgi:hypothetical protein